MRPPPTTPLGPGEAIRIMTGAPMPAGADAVVMVEDTERLDGGDASGSAVAVAPGDAVRGGGRRRARPATVVVRRRHGRDARPSPACWPASTPRTVPRRTRGHASPCCRPATSWSTDGVAAAAGPDPREQPDDAGRRCSPRPGAPSSTSASSRDDEAALEAVLARRRGDVRRASSPAAA